MDSRGGQAWEKGHRKRMTVWLAVALRGSITGVNCRVAGDEETVRRPGKRSATGQVTARQRPVINRADAPLRTGKSRLPPTR